MSQLSYKNVFVVSLPRSGSTVLTNLLDKRQDILSMPESFFPAMMDQIDESTFRDKSLVAALFMRSCSDGCPLSFQEASSCISNDRLDTLNRIARHVAAKIGRDPDSISVVVWKSTRIVGCRKWATAVGWRFVILRRPLANVYDSQFRVHFGEKNRNPLRFALFAASYHWAFANYPAERTYNLLYARIPEELDDLARWMGSEKEPVTDRSGAIEKLAGRNEWHSSIDKPFVNNDEEKASKLDKKTVSILMAATTIFERIPGFSRLARLAADTRHYRKLLREAKALARQEAGNV